MNDSTQRSYIQDLSALLANVLPVIQLFFTRLPDNLTNLFLAQEYFTGISIVTLVVSYIAILAYRANPFPIITLPFQRKQKAKYEDYTGKLAETANARTVVQGEQMSAAKLKEFKKYLEIEPVAKPRQVTQSNLLSICVSAVAISALGFVVLGQLESRLVIAIVQSVMYLTLITSSVLVLTVYRTVYVNRKTFESDDVVKNERAIELAKRFGVFELEPQVKYIGSYDDNQLPQQFHVFVEHNGQRFEIITDWRARRLHAAYPIQEDPPPTP